MSEQGRVSPADVGDRLRQLREARGLKREHIALALETTTENWRHYEKGRSHLLAETLPLLAAVLGMSPGELATALFEPPAPVNTSKRKQTGKNSAHTVNYDYTGHRAMRVLVPA